MQSATRCPRDRSRSLSVLRPSSWSGASCACWQDAGAARGNRRWRAAARVGGPQDVGPGRHSGRTGSQGCGLARVVFHVVMGQVEIRVRAVENDNVEIRVPFDQAHELGDGRRSDGVDRRVVERHPAVAGPTAVDAEMRPRPGAGVRDPAVAGSAAVDLCSSIIPQRPNHAYYPAWTAPAPGWGRVGHPGPVPLVTLPGRRTRSGRDFLPEGRPRLVFVVVMPSVAGPRIGQLTAGASPAGLRPG